jgi:hypothetical protein
VEAIAFVAVNLLSLDGAETIDDIENIPNALSSALG